jgi:hypothetical protein
VPASRIIIVDGPLNACVAACHKPYDANWRE